MAALELIPTNGGVATLRELQKRALEESTSLSEALTIRDKAKLLQEWTKIHAEAESLRGEALRLECCALRRIGQLTDGKWTKNVHLIRAARLFAKASVAEFENLLDLVADHGSVGRLVRHLSDEFQSVKEATARQWQLNQIAEGTAIAPDRGLEEIADYEVERLRQAATVLLSHLETTNESFTVSEAARSLLRDLSIHDASEAEAYAIRELIREVIRATPENSGYQRWVGQPSFITYYDAVLEQWLRIPFHAGSLSQLQFMVAFRKEQAAALQVKAEELAEFAQILEEAYDGRRQSSNLGDLLRRAERSVNRLRPKLRPKDAA